MPLSATDTRSCQADIGDYTEWQRQQAGSSRSSTSIHHVTREEPLGAHNERAPAEPLVPSRVGQGLLDPRGRPKELERLIPDAVPGRRPLLKFEFQSP